MSDAQALQIAYIPSCSQQTQYTQYNAADAAAYTPDHAAYYRHQVPVMLPGAIIGAVCLLAASAFLAWVSRQAELFLLRHRLAHQRFIQRYITTLVCFCSCWPSVADLGRRGSSRTPRWGLKTQIIRACQCRYSNDLGRALC